MIDWKKSAELNNMSIDRLKTRFERFPQSHKRVITICDNPECEKEREIQFRDYRDLCLSCAEKRRFEKPEERKMNSIKSIKYWSEQEHRDEQSEKITDLWLDQDYCDKQYKGRKKRYEDPEERRRTGEISKKVWENPELRRKQSESLKNSEKHQKQIGGNDIVKHHYIYDESDLSKYTTEMTRSKHTQIHNAMRKEGIIVPHINIKGDING